MLGTATVTHADATTAGVHRLAGDDRYATAAAVALGQGMPTGTSVYLATGTNFPDALAGSPLAAADGAVVLLTRSTDLPNATADALATLRPQAIVALGSTSAISEDVLEAAGAAGGTSALARIGGTDRYDTAAQIAGVVSSQPDVVYLAVGTNYPDALAAGAATGGQPVLLTATDRLPAATRDALARLRPGRVVALGGASAVSDATLREAAAASGGAAMDRIAGGDRYATAVAIARERFGTPDVVYVAVGSNYPDALAGGTAAVREAAPILLVASDRVPSVVRDYLVGLPDLRRIVVLGANGAISRDVEDDLRDLLGTCPEEVPIAVQTEDLHGCVADADADGVLELAVVDVNRDGYHEFIAADTDDNGVFEDAGIDGDGDGNVDAIARDLDQDGAVDWLYLDRILSENVRERAYDVRVRGRLEIFCDQNENGAYEVRLVDEDGDGRVDYWYFDRNEDGIAERNDTSVHPDDVCGVRVNQSPDPFDERLGEFTVTMQTLDLLARSNY